MEVLLKAIAQQHNFLYLEIHQNNQKSQYVLPLGFQTGLAWLVLYYLDFILAFGAFGDSVTCLEIGCK